MQARKKNKNKFDKGFLCVDSQEKIEIHYGRENNQGKIAKTNGQNLMLLHYAFTQQTQQYRGTEVKMARKIESRR